MKWPLKERHYSSFGATNACQPVTCSAKRVWTHSRACRHLCSSRMSRHSLLPAPGSGHEEHKGETPKEHYGCRNSALVHNCIRFSYKVGRWPCAHVAPAVSLKSRRWHRRKRPAQFRRWPAKGCSAPRPAFCTAFHGIRLGHTHGLVRCARVGGGQWHVFLACWQPCAAFGLGVVVWHQNAPIHSRRTSGNQC